MTSYESISCDIRQMLTDAVINAPESPAARRDYFKNVIGGIAHALDSAKAEDHSPIENKPMCGMEKFLTVREGVKLCRFNGKDVIKLVARRVGKQGNPNTLFEILVNKKDKLAVVSRDLEPMFLVRGLSVGLKHIEKMAVSSLHRYFNSQRPSKSVRRRKAKLRESAMPF